VTVTPHGWANLQDPAGGVRGTCLVAMSFEPELTPFFENVLSPAITAAGLRDLRVDREHHNDNINERMMADIRRSEALVADFTFHRAGVYFEAGFALGLDRTVVFCCRKDQFSKAHFDTRPYNHLLWTEDSLDDFRKDLVARLRNTVPSLKSS
jgi:nucleoside 2-deoxyribosyltransferase